MTIELRIDNIVDRAQLSAILAEAGYQVHVEVIDHPTLITKKAYFVVVSDVLAARKET